MNDQGDLRVHIYILSKKMETNPTATAKAIKGKFKKEEKKRFFTELDKKIKLITPILMDSTMQDSITFMISFVTDTRPMSYPFKSYKVKASLIYGSSRITYTITRNNDTINWTMTQKAMKEFFEKEIENNIEIF